MTTINSPDEMRAHLAQKASADGEFRAQLIADPRGTIEQELGTAIPDSVQIHIHEDGAESAHLVLPPSPELSEAQLGQIAGAKSSAYYACM